MNKSTQTVATNPIAVQIGTEVPTTPEELALLRRVWSEVAEETGIGNYLRITVSEVPMNGAAVLPDGYGIIGIGHCYLDDARAGLERALVRCARIVLRDRAALADGARRGLTSEQVAGEQIDAMLGAGWREAAR